MLNLLYKKTLLILYAASKNNSHEPRKEIDALSENAANPRQKPQGQCLAYF